MGGSANRGPTLAQQNKTLQANLAAERARAAEQQRLFEEQKKLRQTEMERGKGFIAQEQNNFERQAGVTVPGFEGFRDRETGQLLENFSFDPYKSDMTKSLRDEATSQGPSRWAQAAQQQQAYQQAQGLGRAALEQQKAQSSAMSSLMRQGGLGGGARTSLARSGARDALMAQQGVRAQGAERRFDITDADLRRKQELTGTLADVERQGQLQNIGMLEKDVGRRSEFDKTRYTEQMQAWASKQQADAQRAAASKSSGGCFPSWTKIKLRDGSYKPISEIEVGEELFVGGKVTNKILFSGEGEFVLYDYMGVDVTGSHAVLEYDSWVRVEDSRRGILTTKVVDEVYNLDTELHQLWIGGQMFADNAETDEDLENHEESLRALNGARA